MDCGCVGCGCASSEPEKPKKGRRRARHKKIYGVRGEHKEQD